MFNRLRERLPRAGRVSRPRRSSSLNRSGRRVNKKKDEPYGLLVHIKRAEDLPAADDNGLSDPYIKFILGKKSVGRSSTIEKTLNPSWQEDFFTSVADFRQVLKLEVWDWDKLSRNDYLGEAEVNLGKYFDNKPLLEDETFEKAIDFELPLYDKRTKGPAGMIYFSLRKCKRHAKQQKPKWQVKQGDSVAKQLVIDLVRGKNLAVMDDNGKSDPYCVVNFQGKRSKSKVIRFTTNPVWKERFDFPYDQSLGEREDDYEGSGENWTEDNIITIEVRDKDTFSKHDAMGVARVNVLDLVDQNGGPNEVWAPVKLNGQPAGFIHMYISVLNVLDHHRMTTMQKMRSQASLKLYLVQALKPKAKGNRKVCYVEVQVAKTKLRSQPVEDCRNPKFERIVELPVKDIFSVVEISLFEKKYDAWEEKPTLVGKIAFPLLDIQNKDTEWYVLKNADLTKPVNAQLRLACNFSYHLNPQTLLTLVRRQEANPLTPRDPPSMQMLRHQVGRFTFYQKEFTAGLKAVMGILKWEYGFYPSVAGMVIWFFVCIFYQHWFIPAGLFGFLMYTKRNPKLYDGNRFEVDEDGEILEEYSNLGSTATLGANKKNVDAIDDYDEEDDEVNDDEDGPPSLNGNGGPNGPSSNNLKTRKEKTTWAEKMAMPMKLLRIVQHNAETVADYLERLIGLFTWSNPTLTGFIATILAVATVLLMFVPLNLLLLAAVEWQFVKRGLRKYGIAFVRKPHFIPFEPPLDILKRVPTAAQKKKYARVRADDEIKQMLKENNFPRRSSLDKRFLKEIW